MTHHSRLVAAVVDAPPTVHDRELAFWRDALGRPFSPADGHPEFQVAPLGSVDFEILVQELGSGEPRVHLDVITDDLDAEVTRLEALGAKRVRQIGELWILRDPAGLPFCVIAAPPERFDEENSARWD
ncbi:VOC family protein [Phytomonospora sp. NPDC050363]|uniref:VOC family protein n=1 Tax=Phytomonospora sp. NPDC050363 TaxID=3155642 RepID=UPI0033F8AAEE